MTATILPPGFDEHWSSMTLGEIANYHRDTVDPRRYPSRLFEHYSLPAFDSGQGPIKEHGSAIESIKFVLPPDAVMVSKLNPRIPRVWAPEKIGKNAISSTEFLVLTARAGVKRSFLHWLLRSDVVGDRMKRLAVGTTGSHARIHPTQVRAIEVQVPGEREQYAIAKALDDIDKLISALTALITKKQAIKQGMMQELLTGRTRLPGFRGKWIEVRLGDISKIKTGTRNNQDKTELGRYPFFVRSSHVERIDSYSYDCEAILIPGEGGIGSIFHYINGKFEVHQRVYKISDLANGISVKFIYYYMSHFFEEQAVRNSVKATVDSLRLPTFKNFSIVLPADIREQQAIADASTNADSLIASLERLMTKKQAIKQSMMQELLTGRTRLPVQETVA